MPPIAHIDRLRLVGPGRRTYECGAYKHALQQSIAHDRPYEFTGETLMRASGFWIKN
jgi:hypothetical protein